MKKPGANQQNITNKGFFLLAWQKKNHNKKEISIYERGIQFELLNCLPHCYMWVSPMPKQVLNRYNLTTLTLKEHKAISYDWLILRKGYRLSKEDLSFIDEIHCIIQNNYGGICQKE